jgi:hypothetical protein
MEITNAIGSEIKVRAIADCINLVDEEVAIPIVKI